MNGSPEPPPPPPRNHDTSNSSFNDSKESNEISEAECDRDHGPRGNYGGKFFFFYQFSFHNHLTISSIKLENLGPSLLIFINISKNI